MVALGIVVLEGVLRQPLAEEPLSTSVNEDEGRVAETGASCPIAQRREQDAQVRDFIALTAAALRRKETAHSLVDIAVVHLDGPDDAFDDDGK